MTKNTMLVAILGPVACISILTVVYILDDSIRTEEDVERYLGLSVFGVVPVSTELNSYIKSTGTVNENGKELLEMPKV